MSNLSKVIDQALKGMSDTKSQEALRGLLEAIVDDLTAHDTALKGIADQLDLDAGVTDTTYGSNHTDSLSVSISKS